MIDLLQTGCIVHLLRPSRRQDARRLLGYSEAANLSMQPNQHLGEFGERACWNFWNFYDL
jgi:hypothetical protein